MIHFQNIRAVFKKQLLDTFKNKVILIQYFIFPIVSVVLTELIAKGDATMSDNYFAVLFAAMFAGMIPTMNIVNIITEEKENNTLRVLFMSNVRGPEYLIGISALILILCEICVAIIALVGGFSGTELLQFMGVITIGIVISMTFGGAIGVLCENQMSGSSIVIPFSLIFSFLPMLSNFNADMKEGAKYIYTQQINSLVQSIPKCEFSAETILIILGNLGAFLTFFMIAYKKKGLS